MSEREPQPPTPGELPASRPTSPRGTPPPQVPVAEVVRIPQREPSHVSAPLPPPEVVAHYESIMPGFADRLLKMAEQRQAHLIDQQKKKLQAEINDAKARRREITVGQVCGLLIGLTGIIAGAIVPIQRPNASGAVAGTVISGVTLATLVTAFLAGQRDAAKRRTEDSDDRSP